MLARPSQSLAAWSRWSRWSFEDHPEAELRRWARRLRLFRFVRAWGGHAIDGDASVAAYR